MRARANLDTILWSLGAVVIGPMPPSASQQGAHNFLTKDGKAHALAKAVPLDLGTGDDKERWAMWTSWIEKIEFGDVSKNQRTRACDKKAKTRL